jgi:DNA-binding MarR family transcriptional regulator
MPPRPASPLPTDPPAADAVPRPCHEMLIDELTRMMARQRGDYVSDLFRSGVSTAHLWVLMKVGLYGELSMSGIAELLGIGLPNVTGIVDRMEERGLVERSRDPEDRRVVHVRLTEAGRRIPEGMEGLQRDLLGRVVRELDTHTIERCLAVVREVEAEAGPPPTDPRCAAQAVRGERG